MFQDKSQEEIITNPKPKKNKIMPVLRRIVRFYTCKYRCGIQAKKLYEMENHEKICFCNPETRSCRTCKHYTVDPYYVECSLLGYNMENASKESVFSASGEEIYNKLNEEGKCCSDPFYVPKKRPFPISNCIHFELGKKAY